MANRTDKVSMASRADKTNKTNKTNKTHITDKTDRVGKRIALIGYGSDIRCDDKVGLDVIDQLSQDLGHRQDLSFFKGYNSLDLMTLFSDYDSVYIIDAAFLHKAPGEFISVAYDDINIPDDSTFASHDTSFKHIIPLAKDLGYPVPQITFFLIEPKLLGIGEEYSSELRSALPQFIEFIKTHIDP